LACVGFGLGVLIIDILDTPDLSGLGQQKLSIFLAAKDELLELLCTFRRRALRLARNPVPSVGTFFPRSSSWHQLLYVSDTELLD
jgi:hypothetical protein